MILLLIVGFVMGGASLWVYSLGGYQRDWAMFVGGLLSTFAGLGLLVAGVTAWKFGPDMARMQQTREAVERLGCAASEDVMGTATDWNASIQSDRIWNQRALTGVFVPDGVDTVTLIVIPVCR